MSKTTEEPDQVENIDVDLASDSESELEVESEESASESDSEEDQEEAEMHAYDPEEIIIADFPGLVCDADGFC